MKVPSLRKVECYKHNPKLTNLKYKNYGLIQGTAKRRQWAHSTYLSVGPFFSNGRPVLFNWGHTPCTGLFACGSVSTKVVHMSIYYRLVMLLYNVMSMSTNQICCESTTS